MANIEITLVSGKNHHKVDFGDYSSDTGYPYLLFWAEDIKYVKKNSNGIIAVFMKNEDDPWLLCHTATEGALIVDKILTIAPSSVDDLATKLANLKG